MVKSELPLDELLDRISTLGKSLEKIDRLVTESDDLEDVRFELESEIPKSYNEWYELQNRFKELYEELKPSRED